MKTAYLQRGTSFEPGAGFLPAPGIWPEPIGHGQVLEFHHERLRQGSKI